MKYISLIQYLSCFGYGAYLSAKNDIFCVVLIGMGIVCYINFREEDNNDRF